MSPYWRQLDTSELVAVGEGVSMNDDAARNRSARVPPVGFTAGFNAGYTAGSAATLALVVAWLHDQRPKPDICDCVNGDMNLDWAADQLEHGALEVPGE